MKELKKKFGIVIQARMNSTRLPGKVLIDFCGKPMLLFQINLLEMYNLHTEVVVATSHNPLDGKIVSFCKDHGIKYVRGSEDNVFERFQIAAEKFGFEHVIRLTGDNPLTSYPILMDSFEKHRRNESDLTTTRKITSGHKIVRFAPKGYSVDVINCRTLLNIDTDRLNKYEKEHVIPVFFNGNYRVSYVKASSPGEMSFSIDDYDDFERVSEYVNSCLRKGTLLRELGVEPFHSGRE